MQGVAYVRFALQDEDGKKTFLRGLETQNKVGRRWGEAGGREMGNSGLTPCPVFSPALAGRRPESHFPLKG